MNKSIQSNPETEPMQQIPNPRSERHFARGRLLQRLLFSSEGHMTFIGCSVAASGSHTVFREIGSAYASLLTLRINHSRHNAPAMSDNSHHIR